MNRSCTFLFAACLCAGANSATAAPPKKLPPAVTVKDLAMREAKTCDANHNGRIDAAEFSLVRMAQSKNPKSYLYLFDDNGNKYLDDAELGQIKFGDGAKKKKK